MSLFQWVRETEMQPHIFCFSIVNTLQFINVCFKINHIILLVREKLYPYVLQFSKSCCIVTMSSYIHTIHWGFHTWRSISCMRCICTIFIDSWSSSISHHIIRILLANGHFKSYDLINQMLSYSRKLWRNHVPLCTPWWSSTLNICRHIGGH